MESTNKSIDLLPKPWSSLVEGDEGCISPSNKQLCLCRAENKLCCTCTAAFQTCFNVTPILLLNIVLLKRSMPKLIEGSISSKVDVACGSSPVPISRVGVKLRKVQKWFFKKSRKLKKIKIEISDPNRFCFFVLSLSL